MMDADAGAIVLDVRTQPEFDNKRIPGSLLIPDYAVERKAAEVLPDKNALILIYCRTGRRSFYAARDLRNMGYARAFDFGGIVDWPYETEETADIW